MNYFCWNITEISFHLSTINLPQIPLWQWPKVLWYFFNINFKQTFSIIYISLNIWNINKHAVTLTQMLFGISLCLKTITYVYPSTENIKKPLVFCCSGSIKWKIAISRLAVTRYHMHFLSRSRTKSNNWHDNT